MTFSGHGLVRDRVRHRLAPWAIVTTDPHPLVQDRDRYAIRQATADDLEVLGDIERAAGRCFRDLGMDAVADDDPLPMPVLAGYQREDLAWVCTDPAGRVVAYLIAELVDGNLHVEQVSVHPDHAHRGLGRSLIDTAEERAAAAGVPAMTLTTFRDVPWNAPYYARCGFQVVDEADVTPGLRAARDREAAHGMDRWPRVCMRRPVR
ncbi:MAG: GNAT family N-acetyltransferase [Actinomycetales bacterium]|nr:GNAT family N-acetyltransferase [Actinomycetales bacterium]